MIRHIVRSFTHSIDLEEYLDSIANVNQTIEGVWGTPEGIHVLLCLWDDEAISKVEAREGKL